MAHWLALALPALPLQLTQRRFDAALERTLALVVTEGPAQRARVGYCNERARASGVAPGMKLAAAQALAQDLIAVPRDPAREQAALLELACWAYQFSPQVGTYARDEGCGLLLETGASERLFGGRHELHLRIARELQLLGYQAASAGAETPAAARVLALAGAADCASAAPGARKPSPPTPDDCAGAAAGETAAPALLAGIVGTLPLRLMGWADSVTSGLHALGLATIGEVLALPRDAFARRFGVAVLLDLDRLLGRIADPQPPFTPPAQFTARIELPADTEDAGRLLLPLERLLLLLEGFLRGHNAGATALLLRVVHSARRTQTLEPTRVALALAVPERDPRRLLQLYAERLARVRLPAHAVLLELQLDRMALFVPTNRSFLPPSAQDAAPDADILHLAETLHARLGSEGVFQMQACSDHRPEFAYRITPLSPDPVRTSAPAPAPAQRPMLILPRPQRLAQQDDQRPIPSYRGLLTILAGPERIEAGWWDLGEPGRTAVHRDYFVARNPRGQTLWVYRELAAPHRWFLHGFFA